MPSGMRKDPGHSELDGTICQVSMAGLVLRDQLFGRFLLHLGVRAIETAAPINTSRGVVPCTFATRVLRKVFRNLSNAHACSTTYLQPRMQQYWFEPHLGPPINSERPSGAPAKALVAIL